MANLPGGPSSLPINAERLRKMMDFGLTEYQARVYLTLLDLGSAQASQIPPLSRVPRTRIYATMSQLHEKGLVEIIPEAPLRYKAVPFSNFLQKLSQELRERAEEIEASRDILAREFAVATEIAPETRGHFEAVYGRRNAREKLIRMYAGASREVLGMGTGKSPGRIMKAFGTYLIDKSRAGVKMRYAFPVNDENWSEVQVLKKYAEVRHIDFAMPVYMHIVDSKEFFISHPIPDDESSHRGDDVAIWTDDVAIVGAMKAMADRVWENGQEVMESLPAKPAAMTKCSANR